MSFARVEVIWFAPLPILVLLLFACGARQRGRALRRLGNAESIRALSSLNPVRRTCSRIGITLALSFLLLALAGPRWGKGDLGVVEGRDLMIALDLSKSMLADDMRAPEGRSKQRWQAASDGLHDLVDSIRQRGGHRVGLVVFAAKPWVVCPLTTDYDHFLTRLDEFDPQAPPPETNPEKDKQYPSGTRIGAGVAEAVTWHDPRFARYQDVLLISDGDDPAEGDQSKEIQAGIDAARKAGIPVHVVGVGDPDRATTFSYKRSDGEEEVVGPTRLLETPLKEIAERTGGTYRSDHRERPRLAEFFQREIEPLKTRPLEDDAIAQPRDRSAWFLLPAFVLFLAAWFIDP